MDEAIFAVACDSYGNAYVTGRYSVAQADDDILVLRFNAPDGEVEWSRLLGGADGVDDRGWDIAVGPDGHPVIHGIFGRNDGSADFATIKLQNSDGAEIWRQVHPGAVYNLDARIGWLAVCDNGDIIMASQTWSSASSFDVVLHRYAEFDGDPVWLKQYDNGGAEDARHMARDASGDILVAGVRSGDFMALKFSRTDGEIIWESGYDGPPGWYDAATRVIEGPGGVVVAAGFCSGQTTSWDASAVGFDPSDGTVLWDIHYDYQQSSDEVKTMAVSAHGDIYLVGYGYGTSSESDLLSLRYLLDVSAEADGSLPAPAWKGIHPNPALGAAQLHFEVPTAGVVQVELFDAAGRRVRSLGGIEYEAGPHALDWDGTDESGRPVPAGAYWARLSDGTGSVSRRVVVLR